MRKYYYNVISKQHARKLRNHFYEKVLKSNNTELHALRTYRIYKSNFITVITTVPLLLKSVNGTKAQRSSSEVVNLFR